MEEAKASLVSTAQSVGEALDRYREYLAVDKGNGSRSVDETPQRLRQFFTAYLDDPLEVLCQVPTCKRIYSRYSQTKRTRSGPKGTRIETDKPIAAATHRNVLAQARTFAKWCRGRGWLKANGFDDVEGVGKVNHGKPQLTIDESRKWWRAAISLAKKGDEGAVGAMLAFALALRASEITKRIVRDLDDEGRQLWISKAKTKKGERRVAVPDEIRPFLLRLAKDKQPTAPIFPAPDAESGFHSKDWPDGNVKRICKLAAVPEVCAHSMRGLHSTLSIQAGATASMVIGMMGHEKFSTTARSYIKPGTLQDTAQRTTMKVIKGGRK
jgi:integrase